MDDVIKNVRESFINEGIDEQVLKELKEVQFPTSNAEIWEYLHYPIYSIVCLLVFVPSYFGGKVL